MPKTEVLAARVEPALIRRLDSLATLAGLTRGETLRRLIEGARLVEQTTHMPIAELSKADTGAKVVEATRAGVAESSYSPVP